MEWIEWSGVKDVLRDCDSRSRAGELTPEEERGMEGDVRRLLRKIGRAMGALHAKAGVVHGDLTTSNVMVWPCGEEGVTGETQKVGTNGVKEEKAGASEILVRLYEIVLIDFGLTTQSIQDEDRAVDLYVLERAFGSTHPRQEGWFDEEVLQSQDVYRGVWGGSKVVLKRLEDLRLRGRKRSMVS